MTLYGFLCRHLFVLNHLNWWECFRIINNYNYFPLVSLFAPFFPHENSRWTWKRWCSCSSHQMTDDFHEYIIRTESVRHVAMASYRLMKYGDFTTESQLFMCHLSHRAAAARQDKDGVILIYSIFIGSILLLSLVFCCLLWERKRKISRKKCDNF